MKIVKETNWDVVIDFLRLNFSSPTHWPDWNLIVNKHFNTEFFYFCAYENKELVGICPVHKKKGNIFLLSVRSISLHSIWWLDFFQKCQS